MTFVRRLGRRLASRPVTRRRVLVALTCLGLSVVPLVGTLRYENAFVLSPLAAGLGVAVAVDAIRRARARADEEVSPGERLLGLCREGLRELAVLAAIAVGCLVLGLLWHDNCDPIGGLAFFAMGPVASAGCGFAAGLWGGVVARRRGWQIAAGLLPFFACTAVGVWRIVVDPVVFAYDPFWGWFSGSIYDEDVGIGRTYLLFRAYNVLGVAAALALWTKVVDPAGLRLRRPDRRGVAGWLAVLVLVGATASIGLRASRFGFTADVESICRKLSAVRETEHFVIHYTPRTADAREIDAIAAEHEFAWARLKAITGREPDEKVHSFVFPTPKHKRALMGAGRVQVAAPWRGQIYLDHRPFPHPVLHHELAHVFGRTVGDDLFGVSRDGLFVNVALIEGFATALAPRASDRLDLHDQVTVLERLGKRPALEAIMGPSFFTQSSSVAYTTAGSFCAWLIDEHGFEPMAELYRSAGDFEAAYGTPLGELETRWLAFLAAREGVTDDDVEAQRQRFRRRSVFQRPCAHRAATVLEDIRRANDTGRWDESIAGYEQLCEIEPEEPEHKIGLAHVLAIAGDTGRALDVLAEAEAAEDLTVSLRASILQRRADVALASGDPARYRQATAALDEALALPLSEDHRRGLLLRRLASREPTLAPLVSEFFGTFVADDDPAAGAVRRIFTAQRMIDAGFGPLGDYLVARQLLNAEQPDGAVDRLERALGPELTPPDDAFPGPEYVRAAREALMIACTMTGRFDRARQALARLEADPQNGNGHRLEYALWRDRIDFFETYTAE